MRIPASTFVQRHGNLPSLPAVCHELTSAIQDPDSSISDISHILRKDPSLVARILKLANSVLYGFPAQIGTIEQAVQLIGLHEVRDLVLATSVIEMFEVLPVGLVDVPSFWKHSVACGLAANLIAQEQNYPEPDRLFVGGLLHDIGRLVMFLGAPAESLQILERCEKEEQLSSRIETEVLGFDHATLGSELVCSWNLPRPLVQIVRGHHKPPTSAGASRDVFIIHYADFITSTLELGNSGEFFIAPLQIPPTSKNGLLDNDRLERLISELENQVEEIAPIFARSKPSAKSEVSPALQSVPARA